MRTIVLQLLLALTVIAAPAAVHAQAVVVGPGPGVGPVVGNTPAPASQVAAHRITPLGWYGILGGVCTAASTAVQQTLSQSPITGAQLARNGLSCFFGPPGFWLAGQLFPELRIASKIASTSPSSQGGGRSGFRPPPPGETRFVANEVLLRIDARASDAYLDNAARALGLTRLETQTFALTSQTIQRWRIEGNRSVPATIQALRRYRLIQGAQPNYLFALAQDAPRPAPSAAQYVIAKWKLADVHRFSNGENITVAVIDSAIDDRHPDLAGAIADRYDALGGAMEPHSHGTGMAGAIAARTRLTGVAPKVRILAIRAFTGTGDAADGTTYNVIKGLDWAARQNARIVNMSFAGPSDPLMRDLFARAYARGMILIAAVGNAGPTSPPLYPAADRHVIGITATDADDKLLQQANRGAQVAVAAPGVGILVPAPNGSYQVTSGTSVASAHAAGVAALMLERNGSLTPDAVRRIFTSTAAKLEGKREDYGAGLIDVVNAVERSGAR